MAGMWQEEGVPSPKHGHQKEMRGTKAKTHKLIAPGAQFCEGNKVRCWDGAEGLTRGVVLPQGTQGRVWGRLGLSHWGCSWH